MNKILWITMLLFIQIGFTVATESRTLRIVSTANVHGETDPCG
jgi:hypothetical protein